MSTSTRERTRPPETLEAPPPPPRRTRPRLIEGRRMQPAGYAFLVCVIALAIATVLDAESLRRTAEIQDGWKRDVGLALTKPLVTVSRGLGLTKPREELRKALGKPVEGGDVEVTFQQHPRKTVPTPPEKKAKADKRQGKQPKKAVRKAPPPKEAFTPSHKLRLWVGGDSLAIVPGYSLFRIAQGQKVILPLGKPEGQVSSGLERPDYYNWFTKIRDVMRDQKPDAVVVLFGGNDDHSYMTGGPPGFKSNSKFGSPAWVREYRRRVGGFMDDVISRGGFIVWVGLPITAKTDQSMHYRLLNRIYKGEAEKRRGHAAYVDTYSLFAKDGRYSAYVSTGRGGVQKVRADDGVHFENEGGDLVAWHVLSELRKKFDLTSWKHPKKKPRSRSQ